MRKNSFSSFMRVLSSHFQWRQSLSSRAPATLLLMDLSPSFRIRIFTIYQNKKQPQSSTCRRSKRKDIEWNQRWGFQLLPPVKHCCIRGFQQVERVLYSNVAPTKLLSSRQYTALPETPPLRPASNLSISDMTKISAIPSIEVCYYFHCRSIRRKRDSPSWSTSSRKYTHQEDQRS